MKFVTSFIIQLCPLFINWVTPCNRCYQAQVLKKITFRSVMRVSRVGFILTQIQYLELCSTTRKRNIPQELHYSLSRELRWTYWEQKEWLLIFVNQLNFHMFRWFRVGEIIQNYRLHKCTGWKVHPKLPGIVLIFIDSTIFTFNKSLNLHLIKLALLKACHGSQACILFYTIHELYMNTRKAFFIITVKSNLSVKIIVFTQPGQHVCVLIKSYSGYLLLIKLFSF